VCVCVCVCVCVHLVPLKKRPAAKVKVNPPLICCAHNYCTHIHRHTQKTKGRHIRVGSRQDIPVCQRGEGTPTTTCMSSHGFTTQLTQLTLTEEKFWTPLSPHPGSMAVWGGLQRLHTTELKPNTGI
jgi:hypothetical protein